MELHNFLQKLKDTNGSLSVSGGVAFFEDGTSFDLNDGTPPACKKCGGPMHGDYCMDDTCVYSDWPQRVPYEEMTSELAHVLRERYDALPRIRVQAEVHSDDRRLEAPFDAAPWFAQASDKEIMDLADAGWGGDEPADVVAEHFTGSHAGVDAVFNYIHAIHETGFECYVDEASAMDWLKQHRHEIWKLIHDI